MLLVGFSDVRASFQLVCFTFIYRMGGSGENNGIWGSLKFKGILKIENLHLPTMVLEK